MAYEYVCLNTTVRRTLDIFIRTKFWLDSQQMPWWSSARLLLSDPSPAKQSHISISKAGGVLYVGDDSTTHKSSYTNGLLFNNVTYDVLASRLPIVDHNLVKDRYGAWMKNELLRAKEHKSNKSPCDDDYIPINEKGPLKVFVSAKSLGDEYLSFYVMAQCLHAWSDDTRDNYNGVVMYNIRGVRLFIVGCPLSYYCSMFKEGVATLTPSNALLDIAEKYAYDWGCIHYSATYPQRRPPNSLDEEFNLENRVDIPFQNHGTIKKKNSTLVIDTTK
ncbi:unnamed protein product, partial [Meganyctiphanes norvegica]